MAGPVQVWSSAGVRCDSGSGGIHVSNITGPMRVSTSMGSILANLLGSQLADSYLATGNGDITVVIPSNVGVNVQAQDNLRIVSEFRELTVRRQGPTSDRGRACERRRPAVADLRHGRHYFSEAQQ